MTKIGTAMMTRLATSRVESNNLPLRRPATTPNSTPKIASTASAMNESLMVTGKARAISSATGRPENEVPKSKVTMPFRYSRYCTMNGLSRL